MCRDLFGRACLGVEGCGFDPQAGPAALSQRGAQTGLSVLRQRGDDSGVSGSGQTAARQRSGQQSVRVGRLVLSERCAGASRKQQIIDNAACIEHLEFSEEELQEIEQILK